jgi:hypothetical protein
MSRTAGSFAPAAWDMVNMVVFSVGCRVQPDFYRARIGAGNATKHRNNAHQPARG